MSRHRSLIVDIPMNKADIASDALVALRDCQCSHYKEWPKVHLHLSSFPGISEEATRMALAMFESLSEHAKVDEDISVLDLMCKVKPETEESHRSLSIWSASNTWVPLHTVVAIVRACQRDLLAPAVGFTHYENDNGQSRAGAIVVPLGDEDIIYMTPEHWVDNVLRRHYALADPAATGDRINPSAIEEASEGP